MDILIFLRGLDSTIEICCQKEKFCVDWNASQSLTADHEPKFTDNSLLIGAGINWAAGLDMLSRWKLIMTDELKKHRSPE